MTRSCHDQEGAVRTRRQRATWLCALALACLASSSPATTGEDATPPQILVLKSAEMPRYDQVDAAFRRQIGAQCPQHPPCPGITTASVADEKASRPSSPSLIVAVGHKAALAARSRYAGLPQLHVMVSRADYQEGAELPQLSAIYLEQPPLRLVRFTRYLLPEYRRIGVLLSPQSPWRTALESAASDNDDYYLSLRTLNAGRDAGRAIRTMKQRIDVLLALPDPRIYNRNTLGAILLTAFRNHIPVVGFSRGMVKAGAVAGVFSSPRTIGEEAGMRALALLAGAPPALQYPDRFETAVNRRVASAMHLELPSDEEIAAWEDLR